MRAKILLGLMILALISTVPMMAQIVDQSDTSTMQDPATETQLQEPSQETLPATAEGEQGTDDQGSAEVEASAEVGASTGSTDSEPQASDQELNTDELPQTASNTPLLILLGGFGAAAALGLSLLRRS